MEIPKNKPYRSKKYRDFIKMQPCIVCWNPGPSDPHHEDQTFHNKGMGIKAPDTQTVPMCRKHHQKYGHNVKSDNEILRYKQIMLMNILKFIDDEFNVDAHVLVINMLTDYLKEQDEKKASR